MNSNKELVPITTKKVPQMYCTPKVHKESTDKGFIEEVLALWFHYKHL